MSSDTNSFLILFPFLSSLLSSIIIAIVSGAFPSIPNKKKEKGKVVGIKRENRTVDERKYYKAVVEFDVEGKKYKVESSRRGVYKVGQKMRVVYNELDPDEAKILPSTDVYVVMAAFIVVGAIISVLMYMG